MAYGYPHQAQSPQMPHQGWAALQPTPPLSPYAAAAPTPTPAIDAAALTPQLQPAYQAPQFAPLPAAPKVKPPSGVLNFFSFRPSYPQVVNTGESSLSVQTGPPLHQYAVQPSPVAPAGYAQSPPPPPAMPAYTPQAPVYQPQPPAFQQPQHYPQPQHQQPQPPPPHSHPQPHPPHPHESYDQAAPPAYSQGPNAPHKWPEKPTIQSTYAAAPAVPAVPAAPPAPVAPPANPQKPQPPDDTAYWAALVAQGTVPLAPKPQLRSLFRGIAACIIRECTVEAVPSCVLSPAQLSMYYGQYSGYGSRSARLFAHAQTAPHALSTLYTRLAVEHVLLPSDPGDGRRRPDMPALTIRGFEHWLLLTALLDPDREHARLAAFIASPGRRIQDDAGAVFPPGGFPRAALPAAPDAFVCRRYGAHLEEALADETPPERDAGWRAEIDELKRRLFEREAELEKQSAEMDALRRELAKQTAAAEAAVAKMAAAAGVVQHQAYSEQRPPQNAFPPQQQQTPQNNPFFQYPPQQQNQYQPPLSPQPPQQQNQYQPPQHYQQQQQQQHPPQPQRRQSEQTHPHEAHPQMHPQRRQTEQAAQQPTYSRPTYQPQR